MTTTQEEDVKDVLCKHCDCYYPATKENFYTCKGKLKLHMCKECWKERSREAEKNRKPRIRAKRDRREYTKMYYARKKLEKQALVSKDI
jgi:hypothetical protein